MRMITRPGRKELMQSALIPVCIFFTSSCGTNILKTEEGNAIIGYLMNVSLLTVMNNPLQRSAAEILEHLCVHCTLDDGYHEELKGLIIHAVPQVIHVDKSRIYLRFLKLVL